MSLTLNEMISHKMALKQQDELERPLVSRQVNTDFEQELRTELERLRQENSTLKQEIAWRSGPLGVLEYHCKHLNIIASEHPDKLAIAVFSCVKALPFDPFAFALGKDNRPLEREEKNSLGLVGSEDWFGRFIGYYSSLDSHLLEVYQNKLDDLQRPLAPKNTLTLTGVQVDKNSPVFNKVMNSKEPYHTVLKRADYGLDLVVKVFPVLDEKLNVLGMVSFTHDITAHLEQYNVITQGLQTIQQSAHTIFEDIDQVKVVAASIQSFSRDMANHDLSIKDLLNQLQSLEKSLTQFIGTVEILSLNARIEAASSGDQNHRFGVIADEISVLTKKMFINTEKLKNIMTQLMKLKALSGDKIVRIEELSSRMNAISQNLSQEGTNYQTLLSTIENAEESYERYVDSLIH